MFVLTSLSDLVFDPTKCLLKPRNFREVSRSGVPAQRFSVCGQCRGPAGRACRQKFVQRKFDLNPYLGSNHCDRERHVSRIPARESLGCRGAGSGLHDQHSLG